MKIEKFTLLSSHEIDKLRKAGKFAARLLKTLGEMVEPGVSTFAIDQEAEKMTKAFGAKSGPLGYHGFPKSICTSINEVVCHGIPSKRDILQNGDIINIDVTPIVDGYYGDTSKTFFVGQPSAEAKQLVEVTKECLIRGIKEVASGKRIGDIGAAIQNYAHKFNYGVVREFVGHGIGKEFHTAPQIPHFGVAGTGRRMVEGMAFTIEPMINIGTWKTKILQDGWTAITLDNKLSAQFEHTLVVTKDGFEIMTLDDEDQL